MERLKAHAWGEDERHFAIPDLRKIYKASNARLRACILLGLNCSYSPIDIQRLKATDLKSDGKTTWIQTIRGKTLVKSKHLLWPETRAAIEAADLFNNPKRGQSISIDFRTVRRAVAPDSPPMKFLRHTSANEVKKLAGGEVSEIHLAHTEGLKMQGPYTDRLWAEHAKALTKLRRVFASVWS
jgi:hypothetical protein